MPERTIVYASTCNLPIAYAEAEVGELVSRARLKNASLGVTGMLLYTGKYFAQVLEGDWDPLGELMEEIKRDVRHTKVCILNDSPIAARRFRRWALGYAGTAVFVEQTILRAVYENGRASQRGYAELVRLMAEFDRHHDAPSGRAEPA